MNDGFEYREIVDRRGAGQSVLGYLSARYRHSSEYTWRARIASGQVRLDGDVPQAEACLRAGQSLAWKRPPWEEPVAPLAFAVLYRDQELLAVAKPRGLPTVPNGGFLTHTLLHLVRRVWPDATPLHRLGRGTSGLVLFALTASARAALSADWREGRVEKVYRALVSGVPAPETFTVDSPIGPVPHARLGSVHAARSDGRAAVSHVRVLGRRDASSLVEVRIETGRPHQIRIHLAFAGHPLVGDPLYVTGGGPAREPGLPGDGGYRLHSHRLAFTHPTSGRRLELTCAPPATLREGQARC